MNIGCTCCCWTVLLPSVDCLYYGVLLAAVPMHSCHPWTVCTMGCCWLQCPCTPAIRGLSVLWGVAGCSAHALLPSVDCLYYGVLLAAVPMHSCHLWTVCTMGCYWLQCPCTPAICLYCMCEVPHSCPLWERCLEGEGREGGRELSIASFPGLPLQAFLLGMTKLTQSEVHWSRTQAQRSDCNLDFLWQNLRSKFTKVIS